MIWHQNYLPLGSLLVSALVASLPVVVLLGLLAFFIPYFVVIGGNELKFLRYTFPLYIAIAAGFGWAMGAANERRGKFSMAIVLGFLGLGGVLDTGGLRSAAVDTLQMTTPDARTHFSATN